MIVAEDPDLNVAESLYAAGETAALWPKAIGSLVQSFHSVGGHLVLFGKDRTALAGYASDFPPEISEEYERHYAHRDQRVQRMLKLANCVPSTELTLMTTEEIRRDPLHQELFVKAGVQHSLCSMGKLPNGVNFGIALLRSEKTGSYTKGEIQRFGRLLRHMERALKLQVLNYNEEWSGSEAAFEALDIGLILLDRDASVLRLNTFARCCIDFRDGLFFGGGRIRITQRAVDERLRAAVNNAIDARPRHGDELLVARPSGKRPYILQIVPIMDEGLRGDAASALIVLRDPEARKPLPAELIAEAFDLTPAEASMALAIGIGARVEDYAEQHRVALSTARWRLKQIFSKTDTHRQSDLVRLVNLVSASGSVGGEATAPDPN